MFGRPENDAAAGNRHEIELQGHALAVLVVPGRAEAGPELLLAALGDVPGDQGRRVGFVVRDCLALSGQG
jgi:hypothetical protein